MIRAPAQPSEGFLTASDSVLTFRGGRIRVDSRARVVLVDGRPAKLGGRAFDLLEALIQRRDRVVPKHELLDVVWPGLVVEENNLQVHVVSLRKLLGPESIVTASGRGYQFTLKPDDTGPHTADVPGTPARAPAPAHASTLFGRDELIASTCELLQRDDVRLLTLTGPGGSGKTRVALRVTADLARGFADGSYVVMLAHVRDPAHVASAIAAALDVNESGGRRIDELVVAHLRERCVLLTLDNFEQVAAAAPLVGTLLDGCPRVKILVTSRVPLRLVAERELQVPPLSVPAAAERTAQALESPAVRLFADRARSIGHPVGQTAADAAVVADICRQLDGLPLAIELAAMRLRVLAPRELAQRLSNRLGILKSSARDVPDRQRTLRGTIAWSYDLLDAGERQLFRRLAVFVGGWTVAAVESISDPADASVDLLDALSSLIDHNLVQRVDDVDGEGRFHMLETIREFAADQLEASGEANDVRDRHTRHFIAFAGRVEPRLRSGGRAPWLARMKSEYGNLRAALKQVVVDQPQADAALELSAALTWFWYFSAQFNEGREWLQRALAMPQEKPSPQARATALSGAARLAFYSGELEEAVALASESVAMFRSLDDRRGLGYALFHLALPKALGSDSAACFTCLEEAARCFRDAGDEWGLGLAAAYHGAVLTVPGDRDEDAAVVLNRARALARALGDNWLLTPCSHYLGSIALRRGDLVAARKLTEEMLVAARDLGDAYRISRGLHQLAEIDTCAGLPDHALAKLLDSLAMTQEQGRTGDLALQLRLLARIKEALSKPDEAVRFAACASRLQGHAATMPPDDRAAHERLCERLRETLGDDRYRSEWEMGAAMSIAQAIHAASSPQA